MSSPHEPRLLEIIARLEQSPTAAEKLEKKKGKGKGKGKRTRKLRIKA